jgi:glycosyltransferase involved in cell wall biosynthesis
MIPIVSIIVPCFNSGNYLPEALQSIETYHNPLALQVIIVDDGSKDEGTLAFLESLDKGRYTIIYQENRGPAAARNTGVAAATTDCILFLDSDNKIRADYIDKGREALAKYPDIAVVYGNAAFFGDSLQRRFVSKPFDIFTLLMGNYIDVCCIIRKKAFDEIGGFDENRILFGHEDWELWIRMHIKGWKFYYINKILFDYRIRGNSLLMQKSGADNLKEVLRFVHKKHLDLFIQHHEMLKYQYEYYQHDKSKPFKAFVKYCYWKFIKKNSR